MKAQSQNKLVTILSFVAGFILCFLLLRQCSPGKDLHKASHTVTTQTVFTPGPEVVIEKRIRSPYPVYISEASQDLKKQNFCDSIRFYSDTTQIDSTTRFIANDSVIGKKLWSDRHYSSRPYITQVFTTITDSIPYPVNSYRHGLFLNGEFGGNLKQFDFSVGANYISKKKWSAGYRYGINQKTHNVNVGIRLF